MPTCQKLLDFYLSFFLPLSLLFLPPEVSELVVTLSQFIFHKYTVSISPFSQHWSTFCFHMQILSVNNVAGTCLNKNRDS